ncbi:hypothetical protein [uncultured Thermosynechococcus sp.]|uniref:hypothetical protein n=1 Tax=uncultured Thermosynechococcus sp. TaxID=436945 RepID=UPI00261D0982|nr:hypothetical protein [uncultured Thermosynechococcus sp.]
MIPRRDGHQACDRSPYSFTTPRGQSAVLDLHANHLQRHWWSPQPTTFLGS